MLHNTQISPRNGPQGPTGISRASNRWTQVVDYVSRMCPDDHKFQVPLRNSDLKNFKAAKAARHTSEAALHALSIRVPDATPRISDVAEFSRSENVMIFSCEFCYTPMKWLSSPLHPSNISTAVVVCMTTLIPYVDRFSPPVGCETPQNVNERDADLREY